MAKIAYTKLKCKVNEDIATVEIAPEITVEVKQYLPIQEKLGLIGRVIELAHEQDNNYSNPVKIEVFTALEMIYAYTNISFTEKQKEDTPKLYDQLYSSGLMNTLLETIPEAERNIVQSGVYNSISSIYQYQNSILGILDTIKTDYSDTELDITKITEKFADKDNLELFKNILNYSNNLPEQN